MTDGTPPMDERVNLPINEVVRKIAPATDYERGFEYFEQDLTDSAMALDSWSESISGLEVHDPEKRWILGVVFHGKLRWSVDAPRHGSFMVEDIKNYPDVRISLHPKYAPRDETAEKEVLIVVEGNDKFTEEIRKTARYLKRNIPSFSDKQLFVFNYGKGNPRTSLYIGKLGEYE